MSEIQEIEVVIDKAGNVTLLVRGVKGKGCAELTGEVEQLLGGHVVEHETTDEYNEVGELDEDRLNLRS